jgi:glycosyltransferase involved in cell wall biosynthesis
MKKSVLFLSNMYPSSEKPYAGVYVKNLYEGLVRNNKVTLDILAMERKFTGNIGSFIKYFKFISSSIPKLFKQYDVLHQHFYFPLVVWSVVYKVLHPATVVIVTFHGTDIRGHFNSNLSAKIGCWLASFVDIKIAVGNELKQDVEDKLNCNVKFVLPAGIDEDIFFPVETESKKFDFIFVGSFLKAKGVEELLSAISSINLSLKYVFVGSGPLVHKIKELVGSHDITIYENLTQVQLAKVYNQSRYLVLPTKAEAFGLVVSEAMFCGVPVVASKIGGVKDQLKANFNGIFIEDVAPCAIAKALMQAFSMSESEYLEMSANAKNSNKKWSMKTIVSEHEDIYLN